MDCAYSRLNPFSAKLLENRLLSGEGSGKEVRHIVFDLADSGMEYRVGQSLGVYATNAAADIDALLAAGSFSGEEPVMLPKAEASVSLRAALADQLHLAGPTKKILVALGEVAQADEKNRLDALLADEAKDEMTAFLDERFFVDLLEEFPNAAKALSAQALVDAMKKLQPRLYSIASSPKAVGTKVELTVAVVRFETNSRARNGVCSSFLGDRLAVGSVAPVFVGDSPFGLTDDDAAPVIMVGPGTGVAPFRAFLQERQARQASGKNWLFFGDQHAATDFLYADEIATAQSSGLLTKLDLAWSRDQAHKIYVQDLMRQNAAELWSWLEAGAYFYVCGDAKRMAKDVNAALLDVIQTQGGKSEEEAAEYLSELKKAKRYLRDVY